LPKIQLKTVNSANICSLKIFM